VPKKGPFLLPSREEKKDRGEMLAIYNAEKWGRTFTSVANGGEEASGWNIVKGGSDGPLVVCGRGKKKKISCYRRMQGGECSTYREERVGHCLRGGGERVWYLIMEDRCAFFYGERRGLSGGSTGVLGPCVQKRAADLFVREERLKGATIKG